MMIDADQESVFQALQAGAMDAVAFENNRGLIVARHMVSLQNLIGKGQSAINSRDSIVQHHIGTLSHGAQNLAAGERRADGVAIRARMRSEHEAVALLDLLENFLQHWLSFLLTRTRT